MPSVFIIIIFKDAGLVHFAHDPGKEVIEFPEITANKRAIIKIPSVWSDRTAETRDMKGHPVDGFANDLNFTHDTNANLSTFLRLTPIISDSERHACCESERNIFTA